MKSITISRGQYLEHIISDIPTNTIVDKTLPNIGATYKEMMAKRHSLLMEPNVPVIKGKKQKGILGIYEGVTIDRVIEYLSSEVRFKKILVTPESYYKVKIAANFLSIDLYNDFFFLFDECDRTIADSGFRKKITIPMDDFFRYKNKAFISATPLEPSDPRFKEQGFVKLKVKPDFNYAKPIDLITTNNVFLSLKTLLDKSSDECYCIFFNSTNMIGAFTKKLGIQEESQIYCSRESSYQLKLSGFTHVSDNLKEFRKYNFFTSRFFSAVDIEMDIKPVVIMISDLSAATHSMLHPRTESVQIVGRIRKGAKKIVHITNLDPDLNPKSAEEVRGWLNGCEQTFQDLKALRNAATNPGSKDTLTECLKLVPYANFINEDGSKNHYMDDNMLFEEEIKSCYISETALIDAYNIKHFECTHKTESYPLSDDMNQQIGNSISTINIVENIIESLKEIYSPSELYTLDNKQAVLTELTKSFPEIVEAFNLLGESELRKNAYSRKQIKKALRFKKIKDQKSDYGLIKSLQHYIEDGVDYPTYQLRQYITLSIKQNNLDLPANLKLLTEYFELGPRKTIGFDKNNKEIKGYNVKQCKFNRLE